jgi:hypothetical protein
VSRYLDKNTWTGSHVDSETWGDGEATLGPSVPAVHINLETWNGLYADAETWGVPADDTPPHGGKGDNGQDQRRRTIYKPTGLPHRRKDNDARVKDTAEIHDAVLRDGRAEFIDGVAPAVEQPPIMEMSGAEIDFEIAHLLHKKLRTHDDELLLLLLMAAAAAC